MINYNAYPNILTGELYYPYGKGKNSSGPSQVDGTPFLEQYFNDTIGWMQAFMIYAGITPSGNSENTDASDILDATKYVAGEQAGGYESDTSDIAYTTEQNVKLKTLFCQTGCSAVTLTKGADTNEANRVRVINNSGAAVTVTDGSNPFTLEQGGIATVYFLSSFLIMEQNGVVSVKTTGTTSYTIPEGQFFTKIIHTPIAAETLTIVPPLSVGDHEYNVGIDIRADFQVTVDGGTGSIIMNGFQDVNAAFDSSGNLDFISPRITRSTSGGGIIDPRDKLNGRIHSNGITEDTLFDAMAPFIPNVGDTMPVYGGGKSITNPTDIEVASFSIAERTGTNEILLSGISDTFSATGFGNSGGDTGTRNMSISW